MPNESTLETSAAPAVDQQQACSASLDCYKALDCILIAVEEHVARDLNDKVRAYLNELERRDLQWQAKYEQAHELWNIDNCRNNDRIEVLETALKALTTAYGLGNSGECWDLARAAISPQNDQAHGAPRTATAPHQR